MYLRLWSIKNGTEAFNDKENKMTELEIFAKTLFGEARGEKLPGVEAVANVILNRVKHA